MEKKVTGKKILIELPVTGQSLISANNADFPSIITNHNRKAGNVFTELVVWEAFVNC